MKPKHANSMVQKTSINIKPCNVGSSGPHNKRTAEYLANIRKEKLYIRTDLMAKNKIVRQLQEQKTGKQHKSIFAPSEAADIKNVMQEYGETTEQQKEVGAWSCDYAEHRKPFDEIKHCFPV